MSAIVAATLDLLAERGYSGLSLAAVAERAGTTTPAIYRRWPSKADLVLHAVFRTEGDDVIADTGDLEADVRTMVRWSLEKLGSPQGRAALAGLLGEPPGSAGGRLDQLAGLWGRHRAHLSDATSRGQVRPDVDPNLFVALLAGPADAGRRGPGRHGRRRGVGGATRVGDPRRHPSAGRHRCRSGGGPLMPDVRIEDLREPRRNAEEQQIFDAALDMVVDLDPDLLVAAAHRRTGLDELGDPSLLDRLGAQVAAVDADAGLSGLGRFLVRQRLVGLLAARLRFEDHLRRHPEALDVELEPPVIVVGLPRSGTTHLVNLLATDGRFRSMPWWEVQEPIPVTGDGPGRDGVDPRYLRCLRQYEVGKQVSPLTSLMHDRPPSSIEEECELMDLDLCTYVLEWSARVPAWRDRYFGLDQDAHYSFLRSELQVLSHLRGPNRWVLKCPQHLEQLGPLMATFPDATIAFTLRDPVAVLQSAITMLAYGDRNRRVAIDADQLAAYWVDRIERLLPRRGPRRPPDPRRATGGRGVQGVHGRRRRHGHPHHRARRPGGHRHGQGRPRRVRGRQPPGKGRADRADLRGDFGLEPDDLYGRYDFYFEAFPQIHREVS